MWFRSGDASQTFLPPKSNRHYTQGRLLRRSVQRVAGPASAAYITSGQRSSEGTSHRWRVVGYTAFDLNGSGFEPQTPRSHSDVFNHNVSEMMMAIVLFKLQLQAISSYSTSLLQFY